jgi:hypothetical protein
MEKLKEIVCGEWWDKVLNAVCVGVITFVIGAFIWFAYLV